MATSNANVLWIITDTASTLFLSYFSSLLTSLPSSPSPFPEPLDMIHAMKLHAYVVVTSNAKQLMARLLHAFFGNGTVFISRIISLSLIFLYVREKKDENERESSGGNSIGAALLCELQQQGQHRLIYPIQPSPRPFCRQTISAHWD